MHSAYLPRQNCFESAGRAKQPICESQKANALARSRQKARSILQDALCLVGSVQAGNGSYRVEDRWRNDQHPRRRDSDEAIRAAAHFFTARMGSVADYCAGGLTLFLYLRRLPLCKRFTIFFLRPLYRRFCPSLPKQSHYALRAARHRLA